jgi:predicted nucleotidyltransferase
VALLELIKENKAELQRRFGIQRIGVIQTHRSGAQGAKSRINLVIEFDEVTPDLFLEVKSFLEGLFGRDVDLATFDEQPPHLPPLAKGKITWWEEET